MFLGVCLQRKPLTCCFQQTVTPEMLELLSRLRHKCAIGYVRESLSCTKDTPP